MWSVRVSPTNLEAISLNYWNIVDFDVISPFHEVDSEVKDGLKSNSVRSGQLTYEACEDNLDAQI